MTRGNCLLGVMYLRWKLGRGQLVLKWGRFKIPHLVLKVDDHYYHFWPLKRLEAKTQLLWYRGRLIRQKNLYDWHSEPVLL